jgi:hypothetical protein
MAYPQRSDKTKKQTGRWCADVTYTLPNGDKARHHRAYASKQEAEGVEAYIKATNTLPPQALKGPVGDTFASVAERFKQKNPKWFAGRNGQTNAQRFEFAVTHLGALPVTAIRMRQLEDFVDTVEVRCGRADQPPANATVNRYLDAVSKVLSYAHKLDLIQGKPGFPRRDNNDGEMAL